MKHKTYHLYYLFYPRGWIIIALLLFSISAVAQEQIPPEEFVIDCGGMSYDNLFVDTVYNSFIQCGFNTIMQRATIDSKSRLDRFNLNAINMADSTDWIYYYSSAYYSKWEAEEDKQSHLQVGVKHSAGDTATWKGIKCWSTIGVTSPYDSLLYGPHYHQEKWYKRWLYMPYNELFNVNYTPRFNMALDIKGNVSPEDSVCRIYVLVKYHWVINDTTEGDSTYILMEPVTLYVSDFADSGKFKYTYFSENPAERNYKYPPIFYDSTIIPYADKTHLPHIEGIFRDDTWAGRGVQFCIDWLRSDTLCTLYIDNIEVYDNYGGQDFALDPSRVDSLVREYAQSFPQSEWSNMKHWIGGHEPHTIDAYTPIKTVDAIVESAFTGAPPLMTTIYPYWETLINNDIQLERYYNAVQPEKLMIDFYPSATENPFRLKALKRRIYYEMK